jgi:hypothetical protein
VQKYDWQGRVNGLLSQNLVNTYLLNQLPPMGCSKRPLTLPYISEKAVSLTVKLRYIEADWQRG